MSTFTNANSMTGYGSGIPSQQIVFKSKKTPSVRDSDRGRLFAVPPLVSVLFAEHGSRCAFSHIRAVTGAPD